MLSLIIIVRILGILGRMSVLNILATPIIVTFQLQSVLLLGELMTKEEATLFILKVLSSRMAILSNPMKKDALDLANEHGKMVEDLINLALERALNV